MKARKRYLAALFLLLVLALLLGTGWVVFDPLYGPGTDQVDSFVPSGRLDDGEPFPRNQQIAPGSASDDAQVGTAAAVDDQPASRGAGPDEPDQPGAGSTAAPDAPAAGEAKELESGDKQPGPTLEGRVLDEGNYGIAGATVKATYGDGKTTREASTTTARDGSFDLTLSADSQETLTIVLIAKSDGYTDSDPLGPFSLSAGGTKAGIELRLYARHTAAGRVMNARGEPVPGAFVEVFQEFPDPKGGSEPMRRYAYAGKTDAEGRYRVASIRSGQWGVRCVALDKSYAVFEQANLFTASPGVEAAVPDIWLQPDTSARVRLVKSDGKPFGAKQDVGVLLRVQGSPDTWIGRVETCGADGVLILSNMGGYDMLSVSLAGYDRSAPLGVVTFPGREADLGEIRLEAQGQERGQLLAQK